MEIPMISRDSVPLRKLLGMIFLNRIFVLYFDFETCI